MKRLASLPLLFTLAAAGGLGGTTACDTEAYCFQCDIPDAYPERPEEDGAGATGGTGGNIGLDSGLDVQVEAEACADTQSDPENCGECGQVCAVAGAFPSCVAGECRVETCVPGFVDLDQDGLSCECEVTGGGAELCDQVDNDCNGVVDDGFVIDVDLDHCGACNAPCADLPNTTRACVAGQCVYTCVDGWERPGGTLQSGCGYQCPVWPPVAETCDGVDQDCDGSVDEDQPGAGISCTDHCPGGLCVGQCQPGVTACSGTLSGLSCIGGVAPSPESCDGADNDCDGVADNGFDFQSDPLHCGNCVTQCRAGDLCVSGQCQFVCGDGFKDLDGSPANGCEYACPVFPEAAEVCDGVDQDCDGAIDDAPTDVGASCSSQCPAPDACVTAGDCSPFTIAAGNAGCYGACIGGGTWTCTAGVRVCDFPLRTLLEPCDGADNDCDGVIDDGWDLATDPFNCGGCGVVCQRANTQAMSCVGGVCAAVTACTTGYSDLDGNPANGCEYQCPRSPPVGEVCDGVDDDCDGVVDNNPNDVGSACASSCPAPDACVLAGTCAEQLSPAVGGCYGVCAADGITVCSGTPQCSHPQRAVEACNGQDDDCDGRIDDGFDVQTSVQHCGACGNVCNLPAVTVHGCAGGVCRVVTCEAGYSDLDGQPSNGCEYRCPVFPTAAEACDGRDNDCDGLVDDAPAGVGASCQTSCPGGICRGVCTPGATACIGGALSCQGGVGPGLEVCNLLDDDCDGAVDDGFNTATNPLHCGSCNNACSFPNAIPGCVGGACTIAACAAGFANLDGTLANGCEHTCEVYPTAGEICNGKDDDCDGRVDAADGSMAGSPNFCTQTGVCAGSAPVCQGALGWRCNYQARDPRIEVDAAGDVVTVETRCDGFDNNCNTQSDETFREPFVAADRSLGTGCSIGVGACAGTGVWSCTTDGTTVECPVTTDATAARDELCNGQDDNCDGQVDERVPLGTPTCYDAGGGNPHPCLGWRDVMVQVGGVYMYAYEAARPDATDATLGVSEARTCSRPGALPWTSITRADAAAACASVLDSASQPMRLCSAPEWEAACLDGRAATPRSWSYTAGATTYAPGTCNDLAAAPVGSWPGGTGAACASVLPGGSVFDLSGNVGEWTSTCDVVVGGNTYCRVRGGNSSTYGEGTTCTFDFVVQGAAYRNFDLGFRCCSGAAP